MKRKIRWGIIGSGGIARRRTIPEGFLKADNAELVCVYDIDKTVNEQTARQFGVDAASTRDDLLRRDIDAVYVATPVFSHRADTCAAAAAGKHILCEKPLGLNVADAEKIIDACCAANVQLGVAFMMRFSAQHQQALQMIHSGQLGQMVYGRAQLSCWYPPIENAWRQNPHQSGGGALMDMGSHCIDLLEMLMGRIVKVSCIVSRRIHLYPVEDSAVVLLQFENGAIGTVDTFYCIPDQSSKNALELYGSRGSLIAHGTIGQNAQGEMTAYLPSNQTDYDAKQQRTSNQGVLVDPHPINLYQAEIEDFSRALIENRSPTIGWEIGLRNQKVLAACYDSAVSGKIITV